MQLKTLKQLHEEHPFVVGDEVEVYDGGAFEALLRIHERSGRLIAMWPDGVGAQAVMSSTMPRYKRVKEVEVNMEDFL